MIPELPDTRPTVLHQPVTKGIADATVYELTNRVNQLEAEIRDLKRSMARSRNLLKAALFDEE